MSDHHLIAYVNTDYAPSARGRQPSVIGISAPQQSEESFECNVYLPDRADPYKIYGVDSLQCIGLAFSFMRSRLKDMVGKGDQLFYPSSDEHIPLQGYFPEEEHKKAERERV